MSCLTSTGPTWCETVDRHAVNRWPSLREIRSKLRKNVVQVNFDGSCGKIELPPHLFVWQSCGYQLSNLAFAFCKYRERFLGGVRCGAGFSGPGRPYRQSSPERDLPQVV